MTTESTAAPAKKTAPRKAAARKAPAKTTPAKAAPAAAPAVEATTFALDALPSTKNWAVFTPPAESGCVGKLYMPLGTRVVKVRAEK